MLERKTLLIDADDTLWENNIYFQEAMAHFLAIMGDLGFAAEDIRRALNDLERENIKVRGYGSKKFILSMKETFERHCGEENRHCEIASTITVDASENGHGLTVLTDTVATVCRTHCGDNGLRCLVQRIEGIGGSIAGRPISLLADVADTLRVLSERHALILFTKGDPAEQMDKVERSGLSPFFYAVEVAREKNADAYRGLVAKHGLNPETTWMVGNSPKSDINPATLAGLRAIFIPHPCTWELEEEPILRAERVTTLQSFRELLTLF